MTTTDSANYRDRLTFDLSVSSLSPVIRGTWVTVSHLVDLIMDGWTWADILRSHPEITESDIRVALSFACDEIKHGVSPRIRAPQPPSIDDLNTIIGHPMAGGQHKEQV